MAIRPKFELKILLMRREITQRSLAFGIRVDESRLSRIIRGYEEPTQEIKDSVCKFLNIGEREVFPW